MKRLIIASFTAGGLLASAAHAEVNGKVVSVSGDPGSVVVLRNGETLDASANFNLLENDRLIVRADGLVEVAAEGCNVSLKAPAMAVMNNKFCSAQPISLEQGAEGVKTASTGSAGVKTASIGGTTIAGGAGAGALAIAAAAGGGGSSSGSAAAIVGAGDESTGADDGPVASGSGSDGSNPVSGNLGDTFEPGSGLDDGLFGFFEATSS
ncbi:MAG: hypothetical protein AAF253_06785 [Pseudomonadota bacterium]